VIQEEEIFYKSLGESIKNYRKLEKASQETLAKHLDLSRISILNIEKGKQKVQIYTLFRIAKFLKITLDDLMPAQDLDIINNKVIEKVNKAGGDISTIEKLQGFIKESKKSKEI
jgi:DNA-binding XRE family transcriptional regulator